MRRGRAAEGASEEARRRILEYLNEVGKASVYQIAKQLNISYGAAQWHLYVLERDGKVVTVLQGRRRVAMLRDTFDAYMHKATLGDLFKDLWGLLRSLDMTADTPLVDALERLAAEWGTVSQSLYNIAKSIYQLKRQQAG